MVAPRETGTNTGFTAKLFLRSFPSKGNCWSSPCWSSGLLEAVYSAARHTVRLSSFSSDVPFTSRPAGFPPGAGSDTCQYPRPLLGSRGCSLCARYGLPRKGNPQRKPLLSCSLLSSSTEACLSQFPVLKLAGAAGGEASIVISEVQGWLFGHSSTSAIGIRGTPGQAANLENRRPWAK